jgi:polysaccharide chain length determinant protein (PEP-CTERM system associated)
MSVEFRQRKPGEYAKILQRRKWLVILPAIAITVAVAYVVYRLPDVYQSTTLIVVKPSTLPRSVVMTNTEDNLTRQLTSISQVVASRSSLEPLVNTYELYRTERLRGEPMESLIDMMRRDIGVAVNTSRNDITNGFNISFRYRDPKIAQAITTELASKYINEQNKSAVGASRSAKQFIDNQVSQTEEELAAIDKQRLDFMNANASSLPSGATALLNQLSGLREEQKALIAEVGRLQDRRAAAVNNLSLIRLRTTQDIEHVAETLTDPKTTMGWSQLVQRRAALEGELTRLKQEYKEIHPDVIAKQQEVVQVKQQMDDMVNEWKEKVKEKEEKLKKFPDITAASVENELRYIDGEIKRQQTLLKGNETQIGDLVGRINAVPGVEVALGAIEREYQTKKTAYDGLLEQQQKISLGADATTQQQGEGIEVIDPANLPSKPVAPKRFLFAALGLGFGVGFGLLLVGVFEGPRLLTIQNSEDARHYTGLPVLLAVPELLTPQEARAVPRRRKLLLTAGVIATIVSIPMLALALKLTHVFEFLMQSSGRS